MFGQISSWRQNSSLMFFLLFSCCNFSKFEEEKPECFSLFSFGLSLCALSKFWKIWRVSKYCSQGFTNHSFSRVYRLFSIFSPLGSQGCIIWFGCSRKSFFHFNFVLRSTILVLSIFVSTFLQCICSTEVVRTKYLIVDAIQLWVQN